MKTLSWRKDIRLDAARCFSGTHASVRFTRETFVDKRLPREACFDLGDVKVEMKRRMKTFSWRKDLKLNSSRCSTGTHAILVEERPQIELVTPQGHMWIEVHQKTFVTSGSRVKRVLPWAMSKWTKHIVTFNEEEDEDTLVEEGPQIERGTVFHRDTRHREIYQRTFVTSGSRVKRVYTWAMSKWR